MNEMGDAKWGTLLNNSINFHRMIDGIYRNFLVKNLRASPLCDPPLPSGKFTPRRGT